VTLPLSDILIVLVEYFIHRKIAGGSGDFTIGKSICETYIVEYTHTGLVSLFIAKLVLFAGDFLYWTDWIEREVGRVHKHNGTHRTVILEQLPDLMGIKAVNISAIEGLFLQHFIHVKQIMSCTVAQ